MKIERVEPNLALPGGIVRISFAAPEDTRGMTLFLDEQQAEIVGTGPRTLLVRLPEGGGEHMRFGNDHDVEIPLGIGRIMASDLHVVTNPVVDALGNTFVTYSGSRGEKVPFSVFMVRPDGDKQPFLAGITNPTGLAIGPDDCLYITSRHDGVVYRSTFDKQLEKHVEGLGIATGMAFDSRGNLLVGDRGGLIYRCTPDRQIAILCELEPSVSAYHLAFDKQDNLFVTGPTLSTQDVVYRITPEGEVAVYFKGFGRPQGIAFSSAGDLLVAASYRGRKGLYRLRAGKPELLVAAPMLVGLAYGPKEDTLYLADNNRLYRIDNPRLSA
jgi:sugar lactone lactonase YvrE